MSEPSRRLQRRSRELKELLGIKYTAALRRAIEEEEAGANSAAAGRGMDGGRDPVAARRGTPVTPRLPEILAQATGAERIEIRWGPYVSLTSDVVKRLFLRDTGDGRIEVSVYPDDTLTQAKALYARPDVIERIQSVARRQEWEAGPNFHFGAWQDGRCHSYGPIELDDYLDLWQRRIAAGESSLPRADWDWYWAELVEQRVVDPEDRVEFDRWFTNTNQPRATPRPGLWISRTWSIDEADALDSEERFVDAVREAIRVVLEACGATIEPAAAAVDG